MARHHSPANRLREQIAQLAARLMAEGTADFSLAKRKAARQLGVPETQQLPNNSEVEEALRTYQALFGASLYPQEAQATRLHRLRGQALRYMQDLAAFDPVLTGSVWRGTATPYSDINLILFADSLKDVEVQLLNRDMSYKTSEKRFRFSEHWRSIPVLHLSRPDEADVSLAVLAFADRRAMPLDPVDGGALQGARLKDLQSLLRDVAD